MTENATFTTESGVVLELRPVNKMTLQSLTLQSGALDMLVSGSTPQEAMKDMTPEKQLDMSHKLMGVLRFCLMYGVVTDPPHDVLEELNVMGVAGTPNIARMSWLMMVLKDDEEAGKLVAAIRGL